MAGDPITALSELVKEVFGFAVDSDGYTKMSRNAKLERWGAAYATALDHGDMAICDAILDIMRDFRKQTGS
jgi:hypothetical protein